VRSGIVFSSRRRDTRSKRDWSSDVCSSDLTHTPMLLKARFKKEGKTIYFVVNNSEEDVRIAWEFPQADRAEVWDPSDGSVCILRSEERRGGHEGRDRWGRRHKRQQ